MPRPRPVRFTLQWLARLAIACVGLLLSYALATLVLGLLPAHRDWRMPPTGTTIWLTTNGVHAALLLPRQNETIDWTSLFAPTNTAEGQLAEGQSLISIGWGDRNFFLNVPDWSDLHASTALYALSGLDSTALHVEYTRPPIPSKEAIPIILSREAYARLATYIRASVRTGADGKALPIAGHAYGNSDAFYEAKGRYTAFTTCNQWVRDALDAAGVRVPRWSPLDWPLFWQLRQASAPAQSSAQRR